MNRGTIASSATAGSSNFIAGVETAIACDAVGLCLSARTSGASVRALLQIGIDFIALCLPTAAWGHSRSSGFEATSVSQQEVSIRRGATRLRKTISQGFSAKSMLRREFITIMAAAVAAPFHRANAQQRPRRIGVLISVAEADPEGQRWAQALLQGLDALGWKPGTNLQVDIRYGDSNGDRIQEVEKQLVAE